jgi:hypothetical protein
LTKDRIFVLSILDGKEKRNYSVSPGRIRWHWRKTASKLHIRTVLQIHFRSTFLSGSGP